MTRAWAYVTSFPGNNPHTVSLQSRPEHASPGLFLEKAFLGMASWLGLVPRV